MNIAFWDNNLCERGTSLGLYNYAYYNQILLKNKSFIFYDKNRKETKKEIVDKFKKHFIVHETDNFKEVDSFLLKYNITHIFIIKSGEIDSRLSKVAKNCIQCVFNCNQPHGEVYCSISPLVNGNNGKYPIIPRIITLPKHSINMRKKLNIPDNAIVFGGYGGSDSFNIYFVHKVVYYIAKNYPNIYFLFANFNRFCQNLPNIIHLPMIVDLNEKVEFINTCDAMLWARKHGETFGQAIGEFSTLNKPVIATKNVPDKAHVHFLGNKALWYNNENDLANILLNFNPKIESTKDWNAYRNFSPEKVMETFKNVFLSYSNKNMICYIIHYTKLIDRKIYLTNNVLSHLRKSKYIKEFRWITEFDKEHNEIANIKKNSILNPSEISCAKKHFFTLDLFKKSNYERCLIIEDDIVLIDPNTFVQNIDNMIENIKDEYNIINFGSGCNLTAKNNGFNIYNTVKCADTYIINKKFTNYINNEYYHLPYDHFLNKVLKENNITCYWYKPELTKVGIHKSHNNHTNVSQQFFLSKINN